MNSSPPNSPTPNPSRQKGLTLIAVAALVCALSFSTWQWFNARNIENTDNAYVTGNVVQITPQIAGTVVSIKVDETDRVLQGQILVKMDPSDTQLAFDQATDQLAQSTREVSAQTINNAVLEEQVKIKQSDLERAHLELQKAQDDLARRNAVASIGGVGKEELEHAAKQVDVAKNLRSSAQAALQSTKDQLLANRALTQSASIYEHPAVKKAASKLSEAALAVQRSHLVSPIEGHVAKRFVQLGQRVAPGTALMTLVNLDQLWVEANFKEVQLRNIRIGQEAVLTADVYGSNVVYHGKVSGLGSGTGAAFSLLPAQNATGNWIKIVQRVPVRISLDPNELKLNPLRIGLSMDVSVQTADKSGEFIVQSPRLDGGLSTRAFESQSKESNELIQRIIKSNAVSK
ncbi:MAG: HlyD family efflux transporter periplasmic adaptor subunit [Burkholderiaceae bacterium]